MSAGAPVDAEAPAGTDAEAEYYQTVQDVFVSHRGDPLWISNADWFRVRGWRVRGVPLRIVLRGIRDAFEGHAQSWARARKVASLSYCEAHVEAAIDRWQRALGEGAPPPAHEALARLADRLQALALPGGPVAAADVRRLLDDGVTGAALDAGLGAIEEGLLDALRDTSGAEVLATLAAEVDADLAPYRTRLPEKVLAQVRSDALARRLLETHGLTRLSLFHLQS